MFQGAANARQGRLKQHAITRTLLSLKFIGQEHCKRDLWSLQLLVTICA